MARGKQYSDDERTATMSALKANAGNVAKTSRECGVPRPTLIRWIAEQEALSPGVSTSMDSQWTPSKKDLSTAERVAVLQPAADEALADVFERVARLYLKRAESKEAIDKTSGKDAVIASATATDKNRLLTGKSTSNTVVQIDLTRLDDDQLRDYERLCSIARSV